MTALIILLIAVVVGNGLLLAFMKGATAEEYTRILEHALYEKEHSEGVDE